MIDDLDFEDSTVTSEPEPEQRRYTPVRQRRQEPEPARIPHSLEAEKYVIACAAMDGEATIAQCVDAGLRPDAFYTPENRVIWECLVAMHERGDKRIDASKLFIELQKTGDLAAIGPQHFLDVTSAVATTAEVATYVESLRAYAARRHLIKLGRKMQERGYSSGDPADAVEDLRGELNALSVGSVIPEVVEPITAFEYPTAGDPNILLGNDDYLSRGGQLLFLSYAGAGKSSFIMDACMSWALSRPWMGVKAHGPLKSLIIQAEDSRRYVGKISASFIAANDLTSHEVKILGNNVHVVKVKGVTGEKFFAKLRVLVAQYKPDLVVINPAYLYAEGDITRAEYAQPFLVGLDAINRDEKFAYIVVHHTGKPEKKDNKGKRAAVEDWESIYMGFGSSYFANWPRCSMLLERKPGDGNRYTLRLGKGGNNAGVTKIVEHEGVQRVETTTSVSIRYSRQKKVIAGEERKLIYWELDEEKDTPEGEAAPKGGWREHGGRKQKFTFDQFIPAIRQICTGQDKRQPFGVLFKAACGAFDVKKSTFNDIIIRALENGELQKDGTDGRYYLPKL